MPCTWMYCAYAKFPLIPCFEEGERENKAIICESACITVSFKKSWAEHLEEAILPDQAVLDVEKVLHSELGQPEQAQEVGL